MCVTIHLLFKGTVNTVTTLHWAVSSSSSSSSSVFVTLIVSCSLFFQFPSPTSISHLCLCLLFTSLLPRLSPSFCLSLPLRLLVPMVTGLRCVLSVAMVTDLQCESCSLIFCVPSLIQVQVCLCGLHTTYKITQENIRGNHNQRTSVWGWNWHQI